MPTSVAVNGVACMSHIGVASEIPGCCGVLELLGRATPSVGGNRCGGPRGSSEREWCGAAKCLWRASSVGGGGRDSRVGDGSSAPHPRGTRHRAALWSSMRAASRWARSCGHRSARGRADPLYVKARSGEEDLRTALEIERVVVENKGMGRREGCTARLPRAGGEHRPRACGTPNRPHVRRARGRALREVPEGPAEVL